VPAPNDFRITAARDLTLASDNVHIWRASLDQPVQCFQELAQTLCPKERERAKQLHLEQDRKRFIVARGVLRRILGHYLGMEPEGLQFRYGVHGKPHLTEAYGGRWLRFNLSHSYGLALYAIAYEREVGVDLEYVRPLSKVDRIADRFFSSKENAVLRTLPEDKKLEAFFKCWTRKEAYVKGRGAGISGRLDWFDVSSPAAKPAKLIDVNPVIQGSSAWIIQDVTPANGCVGAIAVKAHNCNVAYWQFSEHHPRSSLN